LVTLKVAMVSVVMVSLVTAMVIMPAVAAVAEKDDEEARAKNKNKNTELVKVAKKELVEWTEACMSSGRTPQWPWPW
jgi:hypothetical protein